VSGWRYYFPESGETEDDAHLFPGEQPLDHDEAAEMACELDYGRHDGWERGEDEFEIAVVCPDGVTKTYNAHHAQTVQHYVSETV
jgi:hypothetical protein